MVKKKRVRKKAATKVGVKGKFDRALRNLILFLILFIGSMVLYNVSSSSLFLNLFGILSIVLGFVSLAFLIVVIVLLLSKKR
jgi:hypothetical protein